MIEREIRMPYRKYKTSYADCRTVPGTYDAGAKSIVVIIPEGRMKKSGTRGQQFHHYRIEGIDQTGRKVSVTVKAVSIETAKKQLNRNYDKNIKWDLNF